VGLPRLALEGSVGAFMAYQVATASVGDQSMRDTSTFFDTTMGPNPWQIFTSNVAARYYF
jgi:hypothetical protein